jgi:acyl-CoA reductase-like NAD-dependent aldehyde dehydrogenase
VKLHHKINHGWVPPGSPLHSDATDDRYEGEIAAALRRAEKRHRKAVAALERSERELEANPDPKIARTVQSIREEVERRFLELRDLELQMQAGPVNGANRSGKGSVRNPVPKGTKL